MKTSPKKSKKILFRKIKTNNSAQSQRLMQKSNFLLKSPSAIESNVLELKMNLTDQLQLWRLLQLLPGFDNQPKYPAVADCLCSVSTRQLPNRLAGPYSSPKSLRRCMAPVSPYKIHFRLDGNQKKLHIGWKSWIKFKKMTLSSIWFLSSQLHLISIQLRTFRILPLFYYL